MWQDTVMTLQQLHEKPKEQSYLEAQAEISFKAGREEEAKGGHNSISYLEGYKAGKQEGIRELAEWSAGKPSKKKGGYDGKSK